MSCTCFGFIEFERCLDACFFVSKQLKVCMFIYSRVYLARLVFLLLFSVPAWGAGGYIHAAKGDVSVISGKNPEVSAEKGSVFGSNTTVRTGENSHAVLKFEDGQIVSLQANSSFNVKEYRYEPKKIEKSNILFSKLRGGLLFITGLIGQKSKKSFRLVTPNATIGVRGTEFLLVMEDGVLYGKVMAGGISMTNRAGVTNFDQGQTVRVMSPNTLPAAIPVESLPPQIFSQLDAIQVAATSAANIPPVEGEVPLSSVGMAGAASALIPGLPVGQPLTAMVAGSALLGAASAVAGGASVLDAMAVSLPSRGKETKEKAVLSSIVQSGDAAAVTSVALVSSVAVVSNYDEIVAPRKVKKHSPRESVGWYDDVYDPPPQGDAVLDKKSAKGDAILFGRHNFVPGGVGTGEICIFCHTPQGFEEKVEAPLWNRTQSPEAEYKAFSSIGSATAAATGSISIACLSCHDGTQAPNVVINSPVDYADTGIYPPENKPFEVSGKYLKSHHPVSMLFGGGGMSDKQPDAPVDVITNFTRMDLDAMAVRKLTGVNNATSRNFKVADLPTGDKEAVLLKRQDFNKTEHSGSGSGSVWWLETKGTGPGRQKADFYLYTRTDIVNGEAINRPYVECSSCHDPHSTNPTFLRIPNVGSSVCLTCHAK